ncbi:pectate lyase [Termitidicoccus mucosus]|uniref:Pectate lyase n=1 Tax=Termitidicoccus mucosus TaxID=1184151 RepID=A0A178IP25_9BACT|nr:hypothetical protein AW736_05635 [Opitutaceae bacterium TSB47]
MNPRCLLTIFCIFYSAFPGSGQAAPGAPSIDTSDFHDSAQHWYNVNTDSADRVIRALPDQPKYKDTQIREIADNVLLFQRDNGAWPKNYDMQAILTPEQRKAVIATRSAVDTTIDNHNTHSQIVYLARAYGILGDEKYRVACERGFDFILTAQLPCGGFPQIWPNPKGFHAFITYNDGVTIGMLKMLRDCADARAGFEWFSPERREKARAAVAKGVECLLATQYANKQGILQGWGQQHDPKDMKPAKARKYELPSLCSVDTAEIIQYLMGFDNPDARIIRAVQAGAAWLDKVKITDVKVENFKTTDSKTGKPVTDKREVPSPGAGPLWTRFYELETDHPMYATLKSEVVYTFAEVDQERRRGYAWHSQKPAGILAKSYPQWLKRNNVKTNISK